MIVRHHPDLSLGRQCRLLLISRSSFYYTPKGESSENLVLMRRIDELFLKYPFYGPRQMARQLRREEIVVGRHRVRRPMGLEAIYQAPRTSTPQPAHRTYPYLLKGALDRSLQSSLVRRYHLHPRAAWLPVPGGGHGLGDASCARLAAVERHGHRVLPRGPAGGAGPIRPARDLQH